MMEIVLNDKEMVFLCLLIVSELLALQTRVGGVNGILHGLGEVIISIVKKYKDNFNNERKSD
jgi:hypothetical protein